MFTLKIRTDGAAFAETEAAYCAPLEVARILREVADKLEYGEATGLFQTVHDVNGNDVGRWKLTNNEEG